MLELLMAANLVHFVPTIPFQPLNYCMAVHPSIHPFVLGYTLDTHARKVYRVERTKQNSPALYQADLIAHLLASPLRHFQEVAGEFPL